MQCLITGSRTHFVSPNQSITEAEYNLQVYPRFKKRYQSIKEATLPGLVIHSFPDSMNQPRLQQYLFVKIVKIALVYNLSSF